MSAPDRQRRPARRVVAGLWHVLAVTARVIGRGAARLSRWNRRGGAERSGLARLVELHALQTAGDAAVTVFLRVTRLGTAMRALALRSGSCRSMR